MAEYEAQPVWKRRPDDASKNVAPRDLGLPDGLVVALDRWAEVYTGTLDWSDPRASGFATDLEKELFYAWGRSLAKWLAQALGEAVDFFDETSGPADVRVEPGA